LNRVHRILIAAESPLRTPSRRDAPQRAQFGRKKAAAVFYFCQPKSARVPSLC
jgi:hypothetical protein